MWAFEKGEVFRSKSQPPLLYTVKWDYFKVKRRVHTESTCYRRV
jgi:hypothetical protein